MKLFVKMKNYYEMMKYLKDRRSQRKQFFANSLPLISKKHYFENFLIFVYQYQDFKPMLQRDPKTIKIYSYNKTRCVLLSILAIMIQ